MNRCLTDGLREARNRARDVVRAGFPRLRAHAVGDRRPVEDGGRGPARVFSPEAGFREGVPSAVR